MQKLSDLNGIKRIIDANINRAKEGLRVCEEITRFILNSKPLSSEFKNIRHSLDAVVREAVPFKALLTARHSLKDIGRNIYLNELKRRDVNDIFFANSQRIKESIRVLEEFSKLINVKAAKKFKDIRYRVYEIEKKSFKSISKERL